MKHILFVDDEPNVLSGLRRALRGYRDEWDMDFAVGAEQALERLAGKSFDAVVTDMRMPGIDGSQLLKRVRDEHPNAVRIMLSGQSDQEGIQRSVSRTHQYFSKPCQPEELYGAINRSCALRDRLSSASVHEIVSQTSSLPSLPKIYTQVLDELHSPDACVQAIADLIEQDVAMSAKLLQLVNSSFFGVRQRIDSPSRAAAFLGLNVLRPIVLSMGIFSQFDSSAAASFSVDAFSNHSLAVGRAAEEIAKRADARKSVVDDAQMAGLVHDVGQLLLASRMSRDYDRVLKELHVDGRGACDVESEHLGVNHADVGAHLLGLWGLPQPIVEAVAFHHAPRECVAEGFTPLTAVHVANALVNETPLRGPATEQLDVDADYLERLGLVDSLPAWRDVVQGMIQERAQA